MSLAFSKTPKTGFVKTRPKFNVTIQGTIVCEQVNRRLDKLLGKSFMKNKKIIGPKTDPWGTSDKTGTGSEA